MLERSLRRFENRPAGAALLAWPKASHAALFSANNGPRTLGAARSTTSTAHRTISEAGPPYRAESSRISLAALMFAAR
jgi:hypothetical protein